MQTFVDSVSDPKSPNYRQFISPEEVGQRFGLQPSQVRKVVSYLQSQGMKVTLVAKNRLSNMKNESGLGMRIMNYRAKMISGSLSVESTVNRGTVVRCSFPLEGRNGE